MSTKEMVKYKMNIAGDSTEHVSTLCWRVRNVLDGCMSPNAYGICMDPRLSRSKLVEARHAIDRAIATLDATDWPTDADYDLF